MRRAVDHLKELGYVVLRSLIDSETVKEINRNIETIVASGAMRTNSAFYSYNSSPRIVESWKHSQGVRRAAFHPEITGLLAKTFDANPLPFSTINFLKSSQQPLHSDLVHFGTVPSRRLAAAWVALEDIHPLSGPLQVVPRSHKLPEFEYGQIGISPATTLRDTQIMYQQYEQWVRDLVVSLSLNPLTPALNSGDVLIWSSNLLHGSPECANPELSRKSLVIHYIFDDVTLNYVPSHSQPSRGRYVRRNLEFLSKP